MWTGNNYAVYTMAYLLPFFEYIYMEVTFMVIRYYECISDGKNS